jgi:hypothetical protein
MDALQVIPAFAAKMAVPVLDAYAVTAAAQTECQDGRHFSTWELEHEVQLWLSQLACLSRTGVLLRVKVEVLQKEKYSKFPRPIRCLSCEPLN